MLERKAYGEMCRWKAQDSGESALLLEGARRVGKSTIAEEFGRREYRSYALFDFSKVTRTFKDAFLDLRGDMDTLFMYLQTYVNVRLYEREPLVMFDEIPGQLSKHEKRFTLASIEKNARSREYENAAMRMHVSPIEVKSSKRYGTKSLSKFKDKFGSQVGTQYVLHPRPLRYDRQAERLFLPLYMAHLL